ncbi:hypothetical protein MFUL124B02_00085 [Myxococcus fulvus 124B02]|nr:hypothetical protein MFUL124B02_00085 [Myxococcus fulvus 124B02]
MPAPSARRHVRSFIARGGQGLTGWLRDAGVAVRTAPGPRIDFMRVVFFAGDR